jgi:hypothetical protein
MDPIKTKNSEIWIEDGIIILKIFGEITAEEVEKIAMTGEDFTKKSGDNIKYVAIDISGVKNVPSGVTKAAFNYSTMGAAEKDAFICANPVARIIGSFFLKMYKLPLPTRIFADMEEAKKWFKEEIKIKN